MQCRITVDAAIHLRADPQRLRQVLDNLIENAIRYASGSMLEVQAQTDEQGTHLIFSDHGPGVSAEHLPRLFDRLYRVDASRSKDSGGSGLGLAICRSIIEAHGGHIQAQANRPSGLRFDLFWPHPA